MHELTIERDDGEGGRRNQMPAVAHERACDDDDDDEGAPKLTGRVQGRSSKANPELASSARLLYFIFVFMLGLVWFHLFF